MRIDARQDPDTQVLSQQILQTIAANPDPAQCASALLPMAQSAIGASSAYFAVFGESTTYFTLVPGGDERYITALRQLATQLSPGIYVDLTDVESEFTFEKNSAAILFDAGADATIAGIVCFTDVVLPVADDGLDEFFNAFSIVTSRIAAQAHEAHFEQLTMSILGSLTDPILVLDEYQHLILLNPAAEELFSVSLTQAAGMSLIDLTKSEELTALIGSKNKKQTEWVSESGKTFVPRSESILDAMGTLVGWVVVLRDMSRFKKLNRNQYEFTRNVTHDLRSPLTSMHGFASMLELGAVGDLNEKQLHFIEKILSGISQISILVDNIQDAGRYDPETGFYEMSRSQCDLGDLIHRIAEDHLLPAEKQELQLSVDVAANVPIINADVVMLERALRNLVDNAIKYTPNGGSITMSVAKQEEQIIISVADSGLGISPENQAKLFERGVRIHREEHKRIKGSGLGLFIVRSAAQRHGGDAWVKSADGHGSTFFMSIPLEGPNLLGGREET